MSLEVRSILSDPTVVAVRVKGADWPRGVFAATPIPDGWMALVESLDGKRRYVPAGDEPRAAAEDSVALVRNRDIVTPLALRDVATEDGHTISGACDVLLRWRAEPDELAALRKSLLDGQRLTLPRLAERFAEGGARTAFAAFVRERNAADLLESDPRPTLLQHLRDSLKRFCFDTGVEIVRVAKLDWGSDSFARQRALELEAAQRVERIKAREMVEKAALAATHRKIAGLGGLLEKLESAAGESDTQWHELLPALSPNERGQLLENLWRITPDRAKAVYIVAIAGNTCLWLDPANPETVVRQVELPETLGGLRSVTFDALQGLLLVGAGQGVWVLDAERGAQQAMLPVPNCPPQRTGFNAAVRAEDRIVATHSALGCWVWRLDDPDSAAPVFEPVDGAPKRICAVTKSGEDRLIFGADNVVRVWLLDADESAELARLDDAVRALAVDAGGVYAGLSDGTVVRLGSDRAIEPQVVHRVHDAVESIALRRWNDLLEMVVPHGAAGVLSVYAEQGVTAPLLTANQPLRRVWASDDLVVGLTDRRDRLIVMNANMPERQGFDVPIGQMTGRSVQDACIVTSRVEPARA